MPVVSRPEMCKPRQTSIKQVFMLRIRNVESSVINLLSVRARNMRSLLYIVLILGECFMSQGSTAGFGDHRWLVVGEFWTDSAAFKREYQSVY